MSFIYPMFALVILTFIIGFSTGLIRFMSVQKGLVNRQYFNVLSGYSAPDTMVKFGRKFDNLFEMPLLFYTLGVIVIALNINNELMFALGWAFVALRMVHSIIHVTYNNPIHRFLAFFSSSIIVLIMWIKLIFIVS